MIEAEPRLREPANFVSLRAKAYWRVRALVGWLGYGIVVIIIGANASGGLAAVLALIGLVLAVAHLIVMPDWRYRIHRWEVTGTAVYTQSGWINQERRIAPLSRIQTVDSERGPFEQLFGLANVTVTTASAAGPLKIRGLDDTVAAMLVEDLTRQANQTPGDGT